MTVEPLTKKHGLVILLSVVLHQLRALLLNPYCNQKGRNEKHHKGHRESFFFRLRAGRGRSGAKSAGNGSVTSSHCPGLRCECRLHLPHNGDPRRRACRPQRLGCQRAHRLKTALGGDGRLQLRPYFQCPWYQTRWLSVELSRWSSVLPG